MECAVVPNLAGSAVLFVVQCVGVEHAMQFLAKAGQCCVLCARF